MFPPQSVLSCTHTYITIVIITQSSSAHRPAACVTAVIAVHDGASSPRVMNINPASAPTPRAGSQQLARRVTPHHLLGTDGSSLPIISSPLVSDLHELLLSLNSLLWVSWEGGEQPAGVGLLEPACRPSITSNDHIFNLQYHLQKLETGALQTLTRSATFGMFYNQ